MSWKVCARTIILLAKFFFSKNSREVCTQASLRTLQAWRGSVLFLLLFLLVLFFSLKAYFFCPPVQRNMQRTHTASSLRHPQQQRCIPHTHTHSNTQHDAFLALAPLRPPIPTTHTATHTPARPPARPHTHPHPHPHNTHAPHPHFAADIAVGEANNERDRNVEGATKLQQRQKVRLYTFNIYMYIYT